MTTIAKVLAAAVLAASIAGPALAAGDAKKPEPQVWSWQGPFGVFDRAQLQRGYQVYKEVCSACHGVGLLSYRNLGQEGGPEFSEAEVTALAAQFQVPAGPDDTGEIVDPDTGQLRTRPATPADRFRYPYANEQAGRAANNGAYPPDLSLMAKARHDGADYLHALLTGYAEPPADKTPPSETLQYNPYFPGGWIAMPNPLMEGAVTYADGTPATVEQMSKDVTAFLTWASDPHREVRKATGFMVLAFLGVFAVLLYFTYKRIWKDVPH